MTAALVGFLGYLGFSAIGGQFGIESRKDILVDIARLSGQSAALQAEIDAYKHRATLLNADRLDPDIITEKARALLNMANADDVIVMVDPNTGKPIMSSSQNLTENKFN
ncbi:septum formation initiator family protein [Devosia rhodophyticola]|uniref:Septum formation initiator family protein n=1 Tax=Devosia rhodophyticola TaxID=3026423 RepID=A0ABY7YWU1_9HYPH|nr:septum formation initiator family protein [Devosia rhodophyticola]WDR05786.1 septum formation initiator family protein [Devosia rhodophyticola]